MRAAPPPDTLRFHHLDAARALFMLLGIPFHASLAFAGGHWLVMSGSRDPALAILPPLLSDFRMPGFFLIAGFFAALLLERRSRGEWLKGRVERLGLPLLTGIAVIVPFQAAILARAPGGIADPAGASDWLSHLWFLPTLLALCLLLASVWPLVVRARPIAPPVLAMAAGVALYEVGLFGVEHLLPIDLALLGGFLDLNALATFLPFFAIGVALRRSPGLWERFSKFDPAIAIIGLLALVLHISLWEDRSAAGMVADLVFDALSSVCLVQTILAVLLRLFSRPCVWVDRMVDASFTIYLLHHPIVVGLAILSVATAVPPLFAWGAICIAALAVPYAAHRIMRRSPLALWLLNGVRPQQRGWGLLVAGRERASA